MKQYQPGSANSHRLQTDAQWIDFDQRARFEGRIQKALRFLHDEQLLDKSLWTRFVQQFRDRIDSETGAWRGEYWGKMMRGACFVYACTRDEALYRVLEETITDLLSTQDEAGRISTFAPEAELFGWDMWCRKYVLLGMQYFLEISENDALNRRLIDSMRRQADYLIERIGPEPGKRSIFETSQTWRGLNSATILEPIVRLFSLTGEARYLDFATYLVESGGTSLGNLIDLALEDRLMPYQYPVTKAYEMMSFFEGVLEYSRVTGSERCRQAALNFGRRIMETDITIIGSAGCTHELLDHSAVRQSDPESLSGGVMQETCVTVTWMKFCCQLLLLSGDPAFADCIEQSLYNAYLGAINTEKAIDQETPLRTDVIPSWMHFDSYSPLLPGTRGKRIGGFQIMRDGHYYGCCACIGAAGIGIAHKTAVLLRPDGASINLYIPGVIQTVTPERRPLRLHIATAYPADGEVRITVLPEKDEEFTLAFRIPGWCRSATLTVNGNPFPASGGYHACRRRWRAGDSVVLRMAMPTEVIRPTPYGQDTVRTEIDWQADRISPKTIHESPENRRHIAFRRGPLVLAADARLGEDPAAPISPEIDGECVHARVLPDSAAPFDAMLAVAVPLRDGRELTLVDYASAGRTLRADSLMAAWLPTTDPMY